MRRTGRARRWATGVVLGAWCLGSCAAASTEPDPASSSSGPVRWQLKLQEPTRVGDLDLELVWLELEDSRCPVGVQCVRAGEARVLLEARLGDGRRERAWLTLVSGAGGIVELAGARLRLVSVTPAPTAGGDGEPAPPDYRAVVERLAAGAPERVDRRSGDR